MTEEELEARFEAEVLQRAGAATIDSKAAHELSTEMGLTLTVGKVAGKLTSLYRKGFLRVAPTEPGAKKGLIQYQLYVRRQHSVWPLAMRQALVDAVPFPTPESVRETREYYRHLVEQHVAKQGEVAGLRSAALSLRRCVYFAPAQFKARYRRHAVNLEAAAEALEGATIQ